MNDPESVMTYCFDRFVLNLSRGALLTSDGRAVSLRPKSFALLRLLVENAGRVLDHDTIISAVWPGVTVTDESIAQCVRDIRRTMGGDAQAIIRTVPRRGYVFSATVHKARTDVSIIPSSAIGRPIVAILSFTQLDLEAQEGLFLSGLTEEIITGLSCSRTVFVASYHNHPRGENCDFDLMNLARTSGAKYLLDGSARRVGECVRVIARLIELSSNICIWTKRYDRNSEGIISAQDELGCLIAGAVDYAVTAAEQKSSLRGPSENLGPWELYQRGLWHFGNCTPADNDEAARLFRKAISLDASYASPYSALALVHFNEGTVYCSRQLTQSIELAAASAQAAIRLDPDDDDARGIYGIVRIGAGQIDEAWNEVTHGSPNGQSPSWIYGAQGAVQQYAGQPGEGRSMLLKSLQLAPRDPRNAILLTQLAVSHYIQGDYTAAVETARRGLTRYPNYPLLHLRLAAALGKLGRRDEAHVALYRAQTISPATFAFYVGRRPVWYRSGQYELLLDGLSKAGWRG